MGNRNYGQICFRLFPMCAGNTGHTGAAGGLAALFILALNVMQLKAHPHAQLRQMITGVRHVLTSCNGVVPVAVTSLNPPPHGHIAGGVSSFGWSGTIVHGVLFGEQGFNADKPKLLPRLNFRRQAFAFGPAVSRLAAGVEIVWGGRCTAPLIRATCNFPKSDGSTSACVT